MRLRKNGERAEAGGREAGRTAPRAPSEEDGEAAGGQRTVTVTPESPCICTLAVADRHARQPGGGNDPSVHWWVNGTHGGVRPHRGTLFRLEKEGHLVTRCGAGEPRGHRARPATKRQVLRDPA